VEKIGTVLNTPHVKVRSPSLQAVRRIVENSLVNLYVSLNNAGIGRDDLTHAETCDIATLTGLSHHHVQLIGVALDNSLSQDDRVILIKEQAILSMNSEQVQQLRKSRHNNKPQVPAVMNNYGGGIW